MIGLIIGVGFCVLWGVVVGLQFKPRSIPKNSSELASVFSRLEHAGLLDLIDEAVFRRAVRESFLNYQQISYSSAFRELSLEGDLKTTPADYLWGQVKYVFGLVGVTRSDLENSFPMLPVLIEKYRLDWNDQVFFEICRGLDRILKSKASANKVFVRYITSTVHVWSVTTPEAVFLTENLRSVIIKSPRVRSEDIPHPIPDASQVSLVN